MAPAGIVKSNTAFVDVPSFITDALEPGAPVVVVPTVSVVGPAGPVGPVGPGIYLGQQCFLLHFISLIASFTISLFSKSFSLIGLLFIKKLLSRYNMYKHTLRDIIFVAYCKKL